MKMNKIALSLLLSLGIAASTVNAEDGQVNFSGSIIDAACSIAPGSQDQDVALGAIAASLLEKGGKSDARDFQITLENCSLISESGSGDADGDSDGGDDSGEPGRAAAAKAVTVTFDGLKDGDMLALNPNSDAKGAGIVITDASYNPISLGKPSSVYALTNGKNILDFKAYLQGDGESPVETGEFDAVVKFTLNYE